MRKICLSVMLTMFACFAASAQESIIEELMGFQHKSKGIIFISATDSIEGEVTYHELKGDIVELSKDGKKPVKYKAKDIIGFRLDNPAKNYIAAKSDGLDGSIMFYENTSAKTDKLLLLKYFLAEGSLVGVKIEGGKPAGKWETAIYSPQLKKMLPASNKKIAEIIKDCPALSSKVKAKEKGYYVPLITTDEETQEVRLRIVSEYNKCI